MTEKDHVFLTTDEALNAVCRDFRQYGPQILLFSEIIRVLSKGDMVAKRAVGKDGLWINQTGHGNMRWFEGSELVEILCEIVIKSRPDPLLLSAVCARVFQTRAFPAEDAASGRPGIRILTGMEDFFCRQCGRCCQTLNYRNEITAEDVAVWEKLARNDILDWVGVFQRDGCRTAYRMWIKPGTREFAEVCPFLQKKPAENRWICRIHDVKPQICRNYPVSRKHAVMTGCSGFLPVEDKK
jgi:Fe-S-cluster containining protein